MCVDFQTENGKLLLVVSLHQDLELSIIVPTIVRRRIKLVTGFALQRIKFATFQVQQVASLMMVHIMVPRLSFAKGKAMTNDQLIMGDNVKKQRSTLSTPISQSREYTSS